MASEPATADTENLTKDTPSPMNPPAAARGSHYVTIGTWLFVIQYTINLEQQRIRGIIWTSRLLRLNTTENTRLLIETISTAPNHTTAVTRVPLGIYRPSPSLISSLLFMIPLLRCLPLTKRPPLKPPTFSRIGRGRCAS